MGKKNKTELIRITVTLSPEQTEKLNAYTVKVVQKQGKVPTDLRTKLLRLAFDEWMEQHGKDYDIDWSERG